MGKHISVQGDVKGDAIVTAVIYTWNGAVCKFLRWTISGGVAAKPQMISVTGATAGWNGNGHADVEAYSANPDDPYFLTYYSANSLYRIDATGAVTNTIATSQWGSQLELQLRGRLRLQQRPLCGHLHGRALHLRRVQGLHVRRDDARATDGSLRHVARTGIHLERVQTRRGGGQCHGRRPDDGLGRRLQS